MAVVCSCSSRVGSAIQTILIRRIMLIWWSLNSGEDNYFSPDLSDEVAAPYWARVDKPLLILHSGDDEFVPKSVNKENLINRWRELCRPGIASELSGAIPGACHRVTEPESEEWLCNTVIKFLQSIK